MIEKRKIFSSKDIRGEFKKIYDSIDLYQLESVKEVFITTSKKNSLRGMHYQTKPFELNKIIVCLEGKILDVIVNINKKSKNFGLCSYAELNQNESIFVSKDFAHGFYCYKDSTLLYLTDNVYSKENDKGIKWDSINYNWPTLNPILSDRDRTFKKFSEI